jgi:hypothetical protein
MSGVLFLAVVTIVCLGDFLLGLWFVRMGALRPEELPRSVRSSSPAQLRRIGRVFLIAAPLLWLFAASAAFGLFGEAGNIIPIQFAQE